MKNPHPHIRTQQLKFEVNYVKQLKQICIMKPIYEHPIYSISGSIDEEHYGVRNPYNPDRPIIRHKPRHKKGWKKPASMVAQNSRHKIALERASREYRDPVLRSQWESRYESWRSERIRHGKYPAKAGEPQIRFLWDYVRWRCMVEEQ